MNIEWSVDNVSYWERTLTDEEHQSLGLSVPLKDESYEDWFKKNFLGDIDK